MKSVQKNVILTWDRYLQLMNNKRDIDEVCSDDQDVENDIKTEEEVKCDSLEADVDSGRSDTLGKDRDSVEHSPVKILPESAQLKELSSESEGVVDILPEEIHNSRKNWKRVPVNARSRESVKKKKRNTKLIHFRKIHR